MNKQEQKEFDEALKAAIKDGMIKRVGRGKMQLTNKGEKYVKDNFSRTVARSSSGKMSIQEFMQSAEEENVESQLREAVASGLLRTFMGIDGIRYYVDANAPTQDLEP